MADLKIRKVDAAVVSKLDDLARRKKMSREEYLRRYLARLAAVEEVEQIENKYANLVSALADRLEQGNDVIQTNTLILEKVLDGLDGRSGD